LGLLAILSVHCGPAAPPASNSGLSEVFHGDTGNITGDRGGGEQPLSRKKQEEFTDDLRKQVRKTAIVLAAKLPQLVQATRLDPSLFLANSSPRIGEMPLLTCETFTDPQGRDQCHPDASLAVMADRFEQHARSLSDGSIVNFAVDFDPWGLWTCKVDANGECLTDEAGAAVPDKPADAVFNYKTMTLVTEYLTWRFFDPDSPTFQALIIHELFRSMGKDDDGNRLTKHLFPANQKSDGPTKVLDHLRFDLEKKMPCQDFMSLIYKATQQPKLSEGRCKMAIQFESAGEKSLYTHLLIHHRDNIDESHVATFLLEEDDVKRHGHFFVLPLVNNETQLMAVIDTAERSAQIGFYSSTATSRYWLESERISTLPKATSLVSFVQEHEKLWCSASLAHLFGRIALRLSQEQDRYQEQTDESCNVELKQDLDLHQLELHFSNSERHWAIAGKIYADRIEQRRVNLSVDEDRPIRGKDVYSVYEVTFTGKAYIGGREIYEVPMTIAQYSKNAQASTEARPKPSFVRLTVDGRGMLKTEITIPTSHHHKVSEEKAASIEKRHQLPEVGNVQPRKMDVWRTETTCPDGMPRCISFSGSQKCRVLDQTGRNPIAPSQLLSPNHGERLPTTENKCRYQIDIDLKWGEVSAWSEAVSREQPNEKHRFLWWGVVAINSNERVSNYKKPQIGFLTPPGPLPVWKPDGLPYNSTWPSVGDKAGGLFLRANLVDYRMYKYRPIY
jgi:hypothetical protein